MPGYAVILLHCDEGNFCGNYIIILPSASIRELILRHLYMQINPTIPVCSPLTLDDQWSDRVPVAKGAKSELVNTYYFPD